MTKKPAKPVAKPEPTTNADARALDRVQYLEAKLILKPDRFTSVKAFRDFRKIVRKTAKEAGAKFTQAKKRDMELHVREVVFLDTSDYALYSNAFILRRRITYVDGFPSGDPEIVLKFRHTDEETAAGVDVHPRIAGKYQIKFKAEILPLKDRVGGYRILYSHNCQFGLSQCLDEDKASIKTLDKVFPALTALNRASEERVKLVNEGIVEEVLLPLGTLDFGKGLVAKCDISLWRTRGEHMPLVGEFAFQAKFDSKEQVAQKQRDRAAKFYISLQHELEEWLALGVTKTAMVYRLKASGMNAHE